MSKDTIKPTAKLLCGLLLATLTTIASAQTYITDKVVVGVYEQPNPESTLLRALPTGTPLEVIEKREDYSHIRSADGETGWIENAYITEGKPAQLVVLEMTDKQKLLENALVDARQQILDMQEQVASLQNNSGTAEPAELNNLKTSNQALRNQLGDMEQQLKKTKESLRENAAQRQTLEKEIESLKSVIAKTTQAANSKKPETTVQKSDDQLLAQLQSENKVMKKQLDSVYAALSLAKPTETGSNRTVDEANKINLGIGWFVALLVVLLLAGIAIGWKWFDKMYLKRHGGFRL